MNLVTINAKYYGGVDLHKNTMYVCIMERTGKIYLHKNLPCNLEAFVSAVKPFLPDLAIGVESVYCYYWLADACREIGIPFYLGHALYMKAIHGGKKKNDRLDSKTIANLMRSNHFPLAYPYPKEMRATRDLLRRRHYFVRERAACYSHIQTVFGQHAILEVGEKQVKSKTGRRELIQRFADPDLQLSIQVDLDLIDALDRIIKPLELQIKHRAASHDHKAYNILIATPGIGEILALSVLYEIHNINRFPTVQDFCSYARLIKCQRTSVGKNTGGGNQNIGNPYLKWAFNEIILHAQRYSPPINTYYQRLQSKHGTRRAKSLIAHKFGIAIYFMLKNGQAFDVKRFVQNNMR
jgi:transposase